MQQSLPIWTIQLLCILFFISCTPGTHSKQEVESAMLQYDRLIQKMDADSITMLYTIDGDLGDVAHGRDSIRKFLVRFRDFKVLSQTSITNSIMISADTAYQEGSYQQVTVTPQKDTVRPQGDFAATWIWSRREGWRLKRMEIKNR